MVCMDTVSTAALTDFLCISLFLNQFQGKLAHASQIQSTTTKIYARAKKKKKKRIPKGKLPFEEDLFCKLCQLITSF